MAGHCIDQLEIELHTHEVALAEQMIERMSRLHERGLALVIDRVCSEVSGPARLDRIERLELELGPLAVDDLEGDFLREVERALRAALRKQLTGQGSAEPRWRASLELLDVFARTGNLPWWADRGQPALVAEHLRAVLADAPEELMRWLRGRAHDTRALRRLSRHVDDGLQAALVERADLDGAAKLRAEGRERPFAGEGSEPSRGQARRRGAMPSAPATSDTGEPEALMLAVLRALADPSSRGDVDGAYDRIAGRDRERIAHEASARIANGDSDRIPNEASARTPNDDSHGIANEDSARTPNDDSHGIANEERAWTPNDSARTSNDSARIPNDDRDGIANEDSAPTPNDHSAPTPNDHSAPTPNDHSAPTPNDHSVRPPNDHSVRPPNDHSARSPNGGSHGIANDDGARIAKETRTPPATPASEHRASHRRDPRPSHARSSSPEHARGMQPPRPPAPEPLDQLYLDDAGLVILWPFLERFFVRTGLVDAERRFVHERAAMQAIALLSQLASEDPEPLEYRLPLAKLLCGVSPDALFVLDDPLSPEAIDECEPLLAAVVANAPILRGMPAAEFRAAFLQRAAVLTVRDGAWLLRVERRSHDLVLDRFPWSWSWVKLPWMPDPLRVEW